MERPNIFIISVFLVFIIAISGMLFAQRVIDLDKVWGDIRVLGDDIDDILGYAVASGDINGDGYKDIIIGANYADPGGRTDAGAVYVILGSSNPPSTIDLDSQTADITIWGDDDSDACGWGVASGDINNDGYDDIIIGAPGADPGERERAGETYVIFGSSLPSVVIDLNSQPADLSVHGDDADDRSGHAVASGDINGDGYSDVIIGATTADTPGGDQAGETYVVFGSSFPLPPYTIDLNTQSADIRVYGDDEWDYSGRAVASGDVNNDGYDDIIIGADYGDPGIVPRTDAGETYVIFGSSNPSSTIDLSTESADITVYGDDADDWLGSSVASGDINGDGYDDIIIGAYNANTPGGHYPEDYYAGETYVIFGSSFSSTPYTMDLHIEPADITVYGDDHYDKSGRAVSSGDINGDGYDDLIIGAPLADAPGGSSAGKTYVIFGCNSPPSTVDLSTQSPDIVFCGDDLADTFGWSVATGDINGDGYIDVIIGATNSDPPGGSRAGEAYLISGGGAIIAAHGLGGKSWIKQFSLLANGLNSFKAFGGVNSQGEVHLAIGDIDDDTMDEIAAGQGEGGKSWVKFFEVNGSLISTFKAFGASNTNGELHLAIGNFDAETSDTEIAVAQGEGGESWVKTFETDGTFIKSIKAFGSANAQGEVHLAAGDLENEDGISEIIAGMGEGGSSWVKIFSHEGTLIRSFKAFGAANIGGEVRLAVGNFDADADLEIAASTGYNGTNLVKLFEKDGTLIKQFLAFGFGGNTNGDVQITAADIDNDGIDEIICGHGEGGSSAVKVFKANGTVVRSFKAFGGVNAQGEVHLGKSDY